ncbi:putative U-box domain-containing protein 53 [Stylophora pistillata]|uniref:putative U-box domain-containing protein 53 n=1 Tax=Stylophora pistillata TaxID=50429 RepID=UPI000C03C13C|nr:putative U-box domain-containing protein 53 [Stylophora pistillata]
MTRLTEEDTNLLLAITSAEFRFRTYLNWKRMEFGRQLSKGSTVFVEVKGISKFLPGIVRYKGELPPGLGTWFGVELIKNPGSGTCDGRFRSKRYFTCRPNSGVFVGLDKLSPREDKDDKKPSKTTKKDENNLESPLKASILSFCKVKHELRSFQGIDVVLKPDERVVTFINNSPARGTVRYIAEEKDSTGNSFIIVGLELDERLGSGCGKRFGIQKFVAKRDHAIFVPLETAIPEVDFDEYPKQAAGQESSPVTSSERKREQVKGLERCLREKEQQVAHFQAQLREKEQEEGNIRSQLYEKEHQLTYVQGQLQEKHKQLLNSELQITEMEEQMTNIREQVREKDGQVRAMTENLREKDEQLVNSEGQVREVTQQLVNVQAQIQEKNEETATDLLAQTAALQRQLGVKDQELNEIQQTLLTAQRALNERQQSPDWVISRDQIQLTDKILGQGGWGVVVKGKYCGCAIAVKQIHQLILSPHNLRLFEREMDIASRCRHPCFLQFIGATNDEGSPLFVTELMERSLRALLGQRSLSESEISVISLDVARALSYLHQKQPSPIIHRDVSSANVLLWR